MNESLFVRILFESWDMLLEASTYILFGIAFGGIIKVFMPTDFIAKHLGQGKFLPVIKAALFGIPLPLCSCGVLPAASGLKNQGANNGATVAFLISTPESGVDSISITYALLDPLLTIARPLAALITALFAGFAENIVNPPQKTTLKTSTLLPMAGQTTMGANPFTGEKPTFLQELNQGIKYAFLELWGDIAPYFFLGIFLGGLITALIPDDFLKSYLGGGLPSMLLMLLIGIPIYICASASTPIAAALILKGISPGTALVFLLTGPATNITSLSVLVGILGKRAAVLYLCTIALFAVLCGLAVDQLYVMLDLDVRAVTGKAAEIIPYSVQLLSALLIISLSIKPLWLTIKRQLSTL
ncbi:MAG: SO_0444 family Cu/Zn efflux transporter [Proteobacteria bacterium]|nr:SO_0444 family Cu/Zn efflux transporter [Pseudomonadota bacterium]MBU1639977.1 SO_0444 family Cu/Zn efflux transporter [Pseudomonadota bacterium]